MKHLLFVGLVLGLSACGSSGGDSAAPTDPSVTQPSVVSESITVKGGHGFSCFLRSGSLRCMSSHYVFPLIPSVITEIASGVTSFVTYDETICFDMQISARPVAQTSGHATFCLGQASLSGPAYLYDVTHYQQSGVVEWGSIRFSSNFLQSRDAVGVSSQDLFAASDLSLTEFLSFGVVTDAAGVSSSVTCVIASGVMTCPTFQVAL